MAATEKGVWDLQEVRDKQLASEWAYDSGGIAQRMYMWGSNSYSVIPPGSSQRSSPTQLPGDTWTSISGNSSGTITALKLDGTAWGWGYNFYGNIADNATSNVSSPKQIPGTTWRSLGFLGSHSAIATKTDGTLWSWGYNKYGQLGQNKAGSPGPYSNIREYSLSSPTQIPGTTWDKVNSTGSLYGDVAQVGAATKTDGSLWLWGNNENAQLGQGNTTDQSSPVQVSGGGSWQKVVVGEECVMAQKTDGTLWAWGHNEGGVMGVNASSGSNYEEPQAVGTATNWKDFDMNLFGTGAYATKTDGTLWVWGYNNYGQLGLNQNVNDGDDRLSSPTQVGTDTTWASVCGRRHGGIATKTNGTLWIWGAAGDKGQLGQNSTFSPSNVGLSSPTQIGSGTGWTVDSDSPYHKHLFGDGSTLTGALSNTSQ